MGLGKTLGVRSELILTHTGTGETATIRAADIPLAPGSWRAVYLGGVEVRYGPRPSDLRRLRSANPSRRVWVEAPQSIRIEERVLPREARPAPLPATIREYRTRSRAGA